MNTLHLKKGDTAVVLSGKEKGKRGTVISVDAKKSMIVVEGVNMITCHEKARTATQTGGIVTREGAMRASKLMRVCPKCDKPTRPAHDMQNGAKITVCKHCGAQI